MPAESVVDAKLANARRALMQAGAAALGAGGLQPPMPRPAVSPQVRALSMYKPVIVLDPGHGGEDEGASRGHGSSDSSRSVTASHTLVFL